jgi:hypothetical protein
MPLHFVGASSPTSGEKGKIKSVKSSSERCNNVVHHTITSSNTRQRHEIIEEVKTPHSFFDTKRSLFDEP